MIFGKQQELLIERFNDELLVFDLTTNLPYILNHIAAYIFANSDGKTDIVGITKQVCRKYDVPFQEALDDIKAIYDDFIQKKIVKRME